MPPYYADDLVTLHLGDCIDVLAEMKPASVDAIVTDPPYGLEFMGMDWDRPWAVGLSTPGYSDGEHRLARPSHGDNRNATCGECGGRMRGKNRCKCETPQWKPTGAPRGTNGFRRAQNPNDADRDSVFGRTSRTSPEYQDRYSGAVTDRDFKGFVLSQQRTRNVKCPDCGKWAYDHPGRLCECGGIRRAQGTVYQQWCEAWAAECLRVLKPGGHLLAFGGTRTYHRLACAIEDAGFEIRDSIDWIYGSGFPKSLNVGDGRGTALKPAHEPIVVARKPLAGTVTANVLEHGTGALNIDGCRVAGEPVQSQRANVTANFTTAREDEGPRPREYTDAGRWPPNVLLGADAAVELDRQSGVLASGANPTRRGSDKFRDAYGEFAGQREAVAHRGADSGGASRFFPVFRYEAKAGSAERPRGDDGTAHPTVKPVDLMRWLVRLVTPPEGLVLDPFAGSGTTAEACVIEGFRSVVIEKDPAYCDLIRARLRKPIQPDLFGAAMPATMPA